MVVKFCDERNIGNNVEDIDEQLFEHTRPKPAFGRQGLDSDRWARIQFSQVHFGAKNVTVTHRGVQLTSFGAKNVTVTHRGVWCKKRYRYSQGGPTNLLWCKKRYRYSQGGSN